MTGARKVHVGARLPVDLVERLDARVEGWRRALPGVRVTRTDLIQVLLDAGLRHADSQAPRLPSSDGGTHE